MSFPQSARANAWRPLKEVSSANLVMERKMHAAIHNLSHKKSAIMSITAHAALKIAL